MFLGLIQPIWLTWRNAKIHKTENTSVNNYAHILLTTKIVTFLISCSFVFWAMWMISCWENILARCVWSRHGPHSACPEAEFMNSYWELSDLRFLYGFLKLKRRGFGLLSGFPPFSFKVYSSGTVETVRGCVVFEKIEITAKLLRWLWIARRKTLKTFV